MATYSEIKNRIKSETVRYDQSKSKNEFKSDSLFSRNKYLMAKEFKSFIAFKSGLRLGHEK